LQIVLARKSRDGGGGRHPHVSDGDAESHSRGKQRHGKHALEHELPSREQGGLLPVKGDR